MTRLATALLLISLSTIPALSQSLTPEFGISTFVPVWQNLEPEHEKDRPNGGPGFTLAVWMPVSGSIQVGVKSFLAMYDFRTEDDDNSRFYNLDNINGWGVGPSVRAFIATWQRFDLHTFLECGTHYHHLSWIERVVAPATYIEPYPNEIIDQNMSLDQAAISLGGGILLGNRDHHHLMLLGEYDLTVMHREKRADYWRIGLTVGF